VKRALLWVVLATAQASCFAVPPLTGLYRCAEDAECGGQGSVCDDGLCCVPGGEPACRTRVDAQGNCPDRQPPRTWYLDKDQDGWGDANTAQLGCAQPFLVPEEHPDSVWMEQGGDCNDADPGIHPAAVELCDHVDNNCNSLIDEGLERIKYWQDKDQDTFGQQGSEPKELCFPEAEFTATNALDCDDNDPAVHPAAMEKCNGRDDDCNGATDDNVPGLGQACTSGLPGVCSAGKQICSGGSVVCDPTIKPGTQSEACNGLDDNCNNTVDESLPGCLLSPSTQSHGAQDSRYRANGGNPGCIKDRAGSTMDGVAFSVPYWNGAGVYTQVAWAQRFSPNVWDMTNKTLHLGMIAELTDPSGKWNAFKQPVVFLCTTDGAYARFVHTSDANWDTKPARVILDEAIPLNLAQWGQGNGWTQTQPAPSYSKVNRVEIHLETGTGTAGSTGGSDFTVQFTNLRFQ
jgi:hypothetical protein